MRWKVVPASPPSAKFHAVAWGLIVLTVSGCSSWQATLVTDPAPGPPPTKSGELRIRKLDGHRVTLHNWTLEGDTLRGTHEEWEKRVHKRVRVTESVALSDVALQGGRVEGDSLRRGPSPELRENVRVHLADGTMVNLEYASVAGDSLRGRATSAEFAHRADRQVAIALKDVRAIEARRSDSGKTMSLVLVLGFVCGLAVLIGNTLGSEGGGFIGF